MSRKKEVTIGITINLENYENLRLEVSGDTETHEDVDDLVSFLDGMLARFGRGDPATADRVDAYRRRVLAHRPAKPQAPAPAPEPQAEPVASMAAVPAGPGSVQQKVEETSLSHGIEAAAPAEPVAKPIAESTKQSAPVPESIAESTKQPSSVTKPVAETLKQPAPSPVTKPIVETPKQPAPSPVTKPIVEPPKQPEPTLAAKPIVEPPKQSAPSPAAKPIVEPPKQSAPVPESIAESTKQPSPVTKPIAEPPKQPAPGPDDAKPPAAGEGEICEVCGAEVTKSQAKLSKLFMNRTLCKKCMEQP